MRSDRGAYKKYDLEKQSYIVPETNGHGVYAGALRYRLFPQELR